MGDAIDRFFDAAEDILDGTIPRGKIGFCLLRAAEDARTVLWHFALYKVGTACGMAPPANKEWHPNIPGGHVLFCTKCLKQARVDLENNG